ncbi:hypothetical protein NPIL_458181 [Nephila pilipes]|uniref:Uncharacterized protein n=1 Tax=Nephila pilipes TaxID=299642 RepID=A0A8X6UKG3_NEPPI|nr:hypothetical protein NPIL_458181 [Nephila pilipes]
MESTITEIEQEIKHLDLIKSFDISNISDVQKICFQFQNSSSFDSEKERAMSMQKIDDLDPVYSNIARYSLLRSLIPSSISNRICFYLQTMKSEFFAVSRINALVGHFFYYDFENIIGLNVEKSNGSEIEFSEFFLSRCLTLCGEPTFSNFILVASFLSYLVYSFFNEHGCFRVMYIIEFCFVVLYRRIFWKIFKSREDFKKLLVFCDEFVNQMETDATLSGLFNTLYGQNWIVRVNDAINNIDDVFSLTESEIELFKNSYSMESLSATPSELEEIIIDCLDSEPNIFHHVSNCGSKCYRYLYNARHFL